MEKGKLLQDVTVLRQQVFKLEEQLQSARMENQNVEATLDKYAKEKKRLMEEIGLYKGQLS